MSKKKTVQVGRFTVITDDDDEVEICIFKDLVDASSVRKPNNWIEGPPFLRTAGGHDVKWLGGELYEILYSMGPIKARKVGI